MYAPELHRAGAPPLCKRWQVCSMFDDRQRSVLRIYLVGGAPFHHPYRLSKHYSSQLLSLKPATRLGSRSPRPLRPLQLPCAPVAAAETCLRLSLWASQVSSQYTKSCKFADANPPGVSDICICIGGRSTPSIWQSQVRLIFLVCALCPSSGTDTRSKQYFSCMMRFSAWTWKSSMSGAHRLQAFASSRGCCTYTTGICPCSGTS